MIERRTEQLESDMADRDRTKAFHETEALTSDRRATP